LKIKTVKERVGLSEGEIYKRVQRGAFPSPIKLGGDKARASGWLEHEVDQWIHDRVRESRGDVVEGQVASASN
jgi:prophage regulatory protein